MTEDGFITKFISDEAILHKKISSCIIRLETYASSFVSNHVVIKIMYSFIEGFTIHYYNNGDTSSEPLSEFLSNILSDELHYKNLFSND